MEAARARALRPSTAKVATAKMDHNSSMQGSSRPRSLRDVKGAIGLANTGNSCYVNATIQALSNCAPFRQYFTDHFSTRYNSDYISNVIAELLRKMWTVPRHITHMSSRAINSNMKQKMFKGYGQQDAQEFLRCLLNQIHDELQVEQLSCDAHKNSTMSLQSSSSLSNSSQTQLVAAADTQPHPHAKSKESPILRTLSKKSQKSLVVARQESIIESTELNTLVSTDDICMVDYGSHYVTVQKQQTKRSASPCKEDDVELQKGVSLGRSESERSLMDEGSPDSSEHQPLQPTEKHQDCDMDKQPQDMETSQEYNKPSTSGSRKHQMAEDTNKKKVTHYHSIVTDVFEGKIESKVKCLACQKVSVTVESFQDLSLPIPGRKELSKVADDGSHRSTWCNLLSVAKDFTYDVIWGPPTTLQNCLNVFFDTSELRGDNRYFCEHCKSFQNSQKSMKILQLPEVLCIHLKRFRFDAFFSTKISRTINFPLTGLNMAPYLKDAASNSALSTTSYELISFISHLGNAGGGHYVAYAKNEGTNTWLEFNDSLVNSVPVNELQRKEGYVFFFRCANSSAAMTQQRIDQLSAFCMSTQDEQTRNVYLSRHWLSLYYNCSSPGPLFTNDFACSHGAILPYSSHRYTQDWCQAVPEVAGNKLYEKFGGSPPVMQLQQCQICMNQLQEFKRRREKELSEIKRLQARDHQTADHYFLSMEWLLQWQRFIHGKTLDESPPLSIDNFRLLKVKDKRLIFNTAMRYKQISKSIWEYFQSVYGGGPTIILAPS